MIDRALVKLTKADTVEFMIINLNHYNDFEKMAEKKGFNCHLIYHNEELTLEKAVDYLEVL